MAAEPSPSPTSAVSQLGRYTLLGRLAMGGMAELFLARQTGPQGFSKIVVIKRILSDFARDRSFVDMFLNEARLAALINHPNVVSIYELQEDEVSGNFYIVMEYIEGPTLKKLAHGVAKSSGALPFSVACRVIADACGALDYAHNLRASDGTELHLVHRDVSPENILVTYTGQVKVVDFGIAKALARESLTVAGQVKGKFGYMSPEQILGTGIDRRADVWALGITLYWLFTGVKPFRGQNELELMQQIMHTEPVPPEALRTDLPPELSRITLKALTKDVNERYPTALALQLDLESWMSASNNMISGSLLGNYLNEQFPMDVDPDRRLARTLMNAKADSFTPTDVPLPARHESLEPTRSTVRRRDTRRWATVGIVAGVVVTVAVILVAWVTHLRAQDARAALRAPDPIVLPTIPATPVPALTPPPVVPAPAEPSPPPPKPVVERLTPRPLSPEAEAERAERAERAAAARAAARPRVHTEPGTVSFHIMPWADVYLDGRLIGTTPFEPVQVPSGRHKLRLVNDRLQAERSMNVEVKPGETSNVSVRLP